MRRSPVIGIFGWSLILAVAGCGRSAPPNADPELARSMLQIALLHWKDGRNPEELKKAQPPLYYTDLQQNGGVKLQGFEILAGHEMVGVQVKLRAKLQVLPPNQQARERTAAYLIDTGPHRVIVPGEM